MRRILVAVLLGAALSAAQDRPALVVGPDPLPVTPLVGQLGILEDPSGQLGIAGAIEAQARFQTNTRPIPSLGFTRSAVWLRFDITSRSTHEETLIVELESARLSHFTWFVVDAGRVERKVACGAADPAPDDRERYPAIEVKVPPGRTRTLYARAASETAIWLPLHAGSPLTHLGHDQRRSSRDLMIIGFCLALVPCNLLLGALLRQRVFHQLAAISTAYVFYYATFHGYLGLHWPQRPLWLERQGMLIAVALGIMAFVHFNGSQVVAASQRPFQRHLQTAAWLITLVVATSLFVLDFEVAVRLFNLPLVLAIALSLLSIAGHTRHLMGRAKPWFLMAWSVFGVALLVLGLQFMALLPMVVSIQQLQGWLLPAILLSFFLAGIVRHRELQAEQVRRDTRRAAETQAYALIDHIAAGTFAVTRDSGTAGLAAMRFRFISRQFLAMFGLTEGAAATLDELAGTHIHPSDRAGFEAAAATAIGNVAEMRWEGRVIAAGETRTFAIVATPRREGDGTPVWAGLVTDHTARVAAEERLAEALRSEKQLRDEAERAHQAKSLFLAKMSHEIRTPLSALVSLAQAMWMRSERENVAEDFRQFLNRVRSGGHYLNLLLRNILSVSAAESGRVPVRVEEFYLADWVEDIRNILEPIAQYHRGAIAWSLPDDDEIRVRTDAMRLSQITLNLGENALKFASDSGVPVRIAIEWRDPLLCLVVEDGGPGIDARDLDAVFGEFSQAGGRVSPLDEGVGLGLAVVKVNTRLLGGSVRAWSAPGRGTCFVVELPDAAPPRADGESGL